MAAVAVAAASQSGCGDRRIIDEGPWHPRGARLAVAALGACALARTAARAVGAPPHTHTSRHASCRCRQQALPCIGTCYAYHLRIVCVCVRRRYKSPGEVKGGAAYSQETRKVILSLDKVSKVGLSLNLADRILTLRWVALRLAASLKPSQAGIARAAGHSQPRGLTQRARLRARTQVTPQGKELLKNISLGM